MGSLAFEVADRHVIAGRGETPACLAAGETHSFIDLVEQSAAFAGGLWRLGLSDAHRTVLVDLPPSWLRLVSLVAVVRLGRVPDPRGQVRITGDPAVVVIGDERLDWGQVLGIGKVDPWPAPAHDESDLLSGLTAGDVRWFTDLREGRQVELS